MPTEGGRKQENNRLRAEITPSIEMFWSSSSHSWAHRQPYLQLPPTKRATFTFMLKGKSQLSCSSNSNCFKMEPQVSLSCNGAGTTLGISALKSHKWYTKEPHVAPELLRITSLVDPSSYWCLWFLTFGVCILKEVWTVSGISMSSLPNGPTTRLDVLAGASPKNWWYEEDVVHQNERLISCGQSLIHLKSMLWAHFSHGTYNIFSLGHLSPVLL